MSGEQICPECWRDSGIGFVLSRKEDLLICPNSPAHKFRVGEDGFLKSV